MGKDRIVMAHGSGGRMTGQLIESVFKKAWNSPQLEPMLDGALLDLPAGRVVVSTDSFVITPIFFPGGDIGKLSICGTVNDLVACGAKPLYLTTAVIIEEGFPLDDLKQLVDSMARTADEAGVQVVTGDTKVVEKGSADLIFINTTGIGVVEPGQELQPANIKPGDSIIVTGTVGDHGLSIMAQREGLSFSTPAISDCQPLHRLGAALKQFGPAVRCMRDPTRGGLATVLNELADQSQQGFLIQEELVPVSPAVKGACDMLGMDPLYMANEGKMVLFVDSTQVTDIMKEIQQLPESRDARVIGRVEGEPGLVLMETELGARRILNMLEGEHLPRIC